MIHKHINIAALIIFFINILAYIYTRGGQVEGRYDIFVLSLISIALSVSLFVKRIVLIDDCLYLIHFLVIKEKIISIKEIKRVKIPNEEDYIVINECRYYYFNFGFKILDKDLKEFLQDYDT